MSTVVHTLHEEGGGLVCKESFVQAGRKLTESRRLGTLRLTLVSGKRIAFNPENVVSVEDYDGKGDDDD